VGIERISLLKVPLDIVPPEQLPDTIYELLKPPAAAITNPGIENKFICRRYHLLIEM
jgi:hypothetical protein